MAVLTHSELPHECFENRRLAGVIAFHDLSGVDPSAARCIGRNKPGIGDGGIGAAPRVDSPWAAQLDQHVSKFMSRIDEHGVICR